MIFFIMHPHKDEESLAGIIVCNNKGSTNLTNHLVKISVFLWDDSDSDIFLYVTGFHHHYYSRRAA
jgi:hypothetical protein